MKATWIRKHTLDILPILSIDLSVSFEKAMYTVMEGDGEVETCLVLNSPAAIDVFVTISTKQDGDANGKKNLCR